MEPSTSLEVSSRRKQCATSGSLARLTFSLVRSRLQAIYQAPVWVTQLCSSATLSSVGSQRHSARGTADAIIVFGGDTKLNGDDSNPNNDDSLYLLNTTTKIWTVAKVAGAKPSGRYGHTLNMLGPKVLVFGGQVEGFFFNDLVAFDLNTLNHASPRWELITPVEGNDPPPSRTNHIAVTHNDKLYVFGGTNGVEWFNDIWRFDPILRSWTMLKCSGFVPQPREGHSASLVGDVIYVFGGRDVDGNDLGDLSAFKISTSRWFTFQNMGPGPSPRSGHALCTVGKRIYVVGGEGASSRGDEQKAYILDTSKIRFPAETKGHKRNESLPNDIKDSPVSPTPREAPHENQGLSSTIRSVSGQSTTTPSRLPQSNLAKTTARDAAQPLQEPARRPSTTMHSAQGSSLFNKQPQSRDAQRRPSSVAPIAQRNVSQPNPFTQPPRVQRSGSLDSMMDNTDGTSAGPPNHRNEVADTYKDHSTKVHSLNRVRSLEEMKQVKLNAARQRESEGRLGIDTLIRSSGVEAGSKPHADVHIMAPALRHMDSGLPLEPQPKNPRRMSRRLSSYSDAVPDESHAEHINRIAWLETELALARKSGYIISDQSQTLDDSTLNEEASRVLIMMRKQLLEMKTKLNDANSEAQDKITSALAERDVVLRDLAYEKARIDAILASRMDILNSVEVQRSLDLEARLVEITNQQRISSRQLHSLQSELASTKRTREDHNALLDRHDRAASEAEERHAVLLSEHNSLRASHSETQSSLKEHQARRIEAESALSARELETVKLKDLEDRHAKHLQAFEVVNAASAAATSRASQAEVSLEKERSTVSTLQSQVSELHAQLESLKVELAQHNESRESMESALTSARAEAASATSAMTAGVAELLSHARTMGPHDPVHHQTGLDNLERELVEVRELHVQSESTASGHLRDLEASRARVTALETESSSHSYELLALQRRLAEAQNARQDLQSKHVALTAEHSARQTELEESQLRFSALQQIVNSRPSKRESQEKRRSRNMGSPMSFSGRSSQTPDAGRLRELETKLLESAQLQKEMQASQQKATDEIEALARRHEEAEAKARVLEEELTKQSDLNGSETTRDVLSPSGERRTDSILRNPNKEVLLAQARATDAEKQLSESTLNFKERLGQLEADYQSAVHYVKGTEKMLRRMKEELTKYKTTNAKLLTQLEEASSNSTREVDGEHMESLKAKHAEETAGMSAKFKDLESQMTAITFERDATHSELSKLREHVSKSLTDHTAKVKDLELRLSEMHSSKSLEEHQSRAEQLEDELEEAHLATRKLEFENRELERRMLESEGKVKLLLDRFEQSVDTYRRQSLFMTPTDADEQHSSNHIQHAERESADFGGLAPPISNGQQRTSSALDLLANELDQLRHRWETNARLSSQKSPDLKTPESTDLEFEKSM